MRNKFMRSEKDPLVVIRVCSQGDGEAHRPGDVPRFLEADTQGPLDTLSSHNEGADLLDKEWL